MHENMILMLKLFFKLGKPRKIIKTYKKCVSTSPPRLPRGRVVVSIPNTHNFGNFVTQNRKCSCTKVIRSGLYYILKHIKTIRNRYTMHGNMVLVLTIFSKSEKSREKKKVPISDQDCLGTVGWVSIPNTRKFQNPVTQNRKCSCAKVIQSCLYFIFKYIQKIIKR